MPRKDNRPRKTDRRWGIRKREVEAAKRREAKPLAQRARRRRQFAAALAGAELGPNHGKVRFRVGAELYSVHRGYWLRVPGWGTQFLLSSIEAMDELDMVIEAAAKCWLEDKWNSQARRFCCPGCGGLI